MISLLHQEKTYSFEEITKLPVPDYFHDLNLDQVVDAIVNSWDDEELRPYFNLMSESYETVRYRQEIFIELLDERTRASVEQFIHGISTAIRYSQYSDSVSSSLQKWKWRLDFILKYYQSIEDLCVAFNAYPPRAKGFFFLHQSLYEILNKTEVKKLREKATAINNELQKMRFHITINRDRATFTYEYDETDYCFPVRNAFAHGYADTNPVFFKETPFDGIDFSPLEEFVVKQFQKNNRVLFRELETFCAIKRDIISQEICDLVREFRFYLSVSDFFASLKDKGYPMIIPQISKDKELYLDDCYDIALVLSKLSKKEEVVLNDIMKTNFEKAIIVTGPNQGGKTTLARAFGQAFYFGMMGMFVPAKLAKLPFVNQIFTHFACENPKLNVDGRLQNELIRIKEMLATVGNRSVVIMNELFTSAPTLDALSMSRKLLDSLLKVRSICFCVTHTYELAFDSEDYVSLVATVVEDGSYRRTYRIVRKEADGIAFANSIVNKYKLDYSHINYRISKN